MAVKKQTVQAPAIWKSGGKHKNYAIEVLEGERALILSRVKLARAEKGHYKSKIQKAAVAQWLALAEKLEAGIIVLKMFRPNTAKIQGTARDKAINKKILGFFVFDAPAEPPAQGVTIQPPPAASTPPPAKDPELPAHVKAALAGPGAARKVRANCKKFAKCGDYSYTYCFSKCEKREDGTCKLIRGSQAKPKNMAKCKERSYWYCFTKCEKRRKKDCNLVRTCTRGKK